MRYQRTASTSQTANSSRPACSAVQTAACTPTRNDRRTTAAIADPRKKIATGAKIT
jgi:hypothetical protein